ncbi:hypothetical protein CRG98_032803 [Punica granatum]|uniref:Uncharacterized protein n=1 Tax=Punica granatum TaxID=22663 RepID=A0A2I0ITR7_PUNGR|nr:hypothetical protein CRG98_032803 [Punica granatum]
MKLCPNDYVKQIILNITSSPKTASWKEVIFKAPSIPTAPSFHSIMFIASILKVPPEYLQVPNLTIIDLSWNMFDGNLPIPPTTAEVYEFSGNKFPGEIPSPFCNITTLSVIHMSNNSLSGKIPRCLINSNTDLKRLDLSMNRLRGPIPEILAPNNCSLKSIALRRNHLGGKLPQSWASCRQMEALDISNNEVEDSFPSWLGTLPNLYVLILSTNKFHGSISSPKANHPFSKLYIFDISNNNFSGTFPSQYIANFNNMMGGDKGQRSLGYMTNGRSQDRFLGGNSSTLSGVIPSVVILDYADLPCQNLVLKAAGKGPLRLPRMKKMQSTGLTGD